LREALFEIGFIPAAIFSQQQFNRRGGAAPQQLSSFLCVPSQHRKLISKGFNADLSAEILSQ
jgi:hypothetical protein